MNLQLVDDPTERTTAGTDVLMAMLALTYAWQFHHHGATARWKVHTWTAVLAFLAIGGLSGAFAHGFKLSALTHRRAWYLLNASIALMIALVVVGTIYDLGGETASRRALPAMLGVALSFFVVTLRNPNTFLPFIIYEATAMLFALGVYVNLARGGKLEGASLVAAGILITIIAAAVQTSNLHLTVGWEFDHNGLFHLIQMAGLPVLVAGLRAALNQPAEH